MELEPVRQLVPGKLYHTRVAYELENLRDKRGYCFDRDEIVMFISFENNGPRGLDYMFLWGKDTYRLTLGPGGNIQYYMERHY